MKKKPFTLLELLTAMTVFTIFMLAVMRFFGLSQDVMSSSTNNVSQYEKVRVVMDMIAADLQNIYYNEGVGTITYYQQTSNDTLGDASLKSLDIPVQRSQKIGKSDVALARVHYKLIDETVKNSSGTDVATGLKQLQMVAIGNKDNSGNVEAEWALHRYDITSPLTVFPVISTSRVLCPILDGIVDMKIKLYNQRAGSNPLGSGVYYANVAGNARIPDYVVIEIKMVDDNVMKTIREKKSMGITADVNDDDCRLFSRRIEIDRGQSF